MSNAFSRPVTIRLPLVAVPAVLVFALSAQAAEKNTANASDETAIRGTADAFSKAFDRADAKALAALWTENGSLADDRGQVLKGRQAIEDQYATLFKEHPGAKMEIMIQSIEFPAPSVAVEDGLARAVDKNGASPAASRYTAVHVLHDGKWLMASVRESNSEISSNYGRLQQLQWLVGNWETKSEGATVHTCIRWIANRSFLQREYSVRQNGLTTSSGVQIIGWDPQADRVRSWSFDSLGGHGTSLWTPAAEGWRIESRGVLADGTPTSSQDFLVRVPKEDNVFGWRSVQRKIGNTTLPDLREVVLDRLPEKKQK
jgi:uncharacterized protein (TIGR02246 family)